MKRSPESLLRWRKEFPILSRATYLVSNSLGAMPRGVSARMQDFAETWATRGVRAWAEEWWEMSEKVGDTIAPLIGVNRGEVCMHTNISLLQAILISSFDFKGKRNNVVLTDMEFPSVVYVYQRLAKACGARLKTVRSDDGITMDTQKIIDAIDEKTLLVPISHVSFKSAYIFDIPAIAEKARKCGAIVILDAYHSVGVLPVDVRELGVDILVGGVLKWLCGGPGSAFLWIRPSLRRKLEPKITGWLAHKQPFAFEPAMQYTNSIYRFMNGTPPIPALYSAQEGPKIIAQVGVEKIRAQSICQTSMIIEQAQRNGFRISSPLDPEQRAGTVTLDVPHAYRVSRELLRRGIIVDYREGAGVRLAPHFYNTDEEVTSAVDQIRDILASKAYRRHSQRRAHVT